MSQSSQALITAIIPTYRRPQLLRRAIQSVLDQTFPDLQVCVYDNASGDETAAVVAEMVARDSRIHYHCHPINIGALPNFQFGLDRVTTPFFSLLSDDDYLLPDCYATTMRGFADYPKAGFVSTHVEVKDIEGNLLNKRRIKVGYFTPPDGLFAMLTIGHPIWTGTVFRREILQQVGALDSTTGMLSDLDFELRAAANQPYLVTEEIGAVFSFYAQSLSRLQSSQLDSVWPGCEVMRKNIRMQSSLSITARNQADRLIIHWIVAKMRHMALSAMIRRNFDEMIQIAKVLHTYQQDKLAQLIIFLARTCQAFPLLQHAIVNINRCRNKIVHLRYNGLR